MRSNFEAVNFQLAFLIKQQSRGAENRTRVSRTRSVYNTTIIHPDSAV